MAGSCSPPPRSATTARPRSSAAAKDSRPRRRSHRGRASRTTRTAASATCRKKSTGSRNDSDGPTRHMQNDENGLESFDVAAARLYANREIRAPAHESWIDFIGPPDNVKTLSFVDVKNGTFDKNLIKGKLVVVGATSNVLQDYHPTA